MAALLLAGNIMNGAMGESPFSGVGSVILAILIAAGWPTASEIVLGILLGVNLLLTGFGYIFVSRSINPRLRGGLA